MKIKAAILAILILIIGCTLNEPKLPKWDTEWTIFLPTHDYNMADAIEDEKNLIADTLNQIPIVRVNVQDTSDYEQIDESDLSMEPEDRREGDTLDDILLKDPLNGYTNLDSIETILEQVAPGVPLIPGNVIPPYDTTTVQTVQHLVLMESFRYARINSGYMYIEFLNSLFLTIRPGMVINVYDDSLGQYIGPFSFMNSIAPGAVGQSNILNLNNKFISRRFRLEYNIPIEGSESNLELTEGILSGTFQSHVVMREVKVREANAQIPAQSFTDSSKIDVSDEKYLITEGRISRGGAHITFYNTIPLSADLVVKFPYMFRDGDTLEFTIPVIESGGSGQEYFDFSGAELRNMDNPGVPIDSIPFYSIARADSSKGYVTIFGTDSFLVDVHMDSIFIESFRGVVVDADTLTIDPIDQDDFDVFEEIEGEVRFEDLVMNITFENEIDFDILADIWIVGYRGDPENSSDSIRIHIRETIEKVSDSPTTTISLTANSGTPSVVDLVQILPTYIRMYGNAIISGEGGASVSDGIRAIYNIQSPLNLDIVEPLRYVMKTDSIKKSDLDEDLRERITEDTHSADINLYLENGLPVNADVVLILAIDSTMVSDTTAAANPGDKIVISANVEAGAVGASGYVETPLSNHVSVNLDNEQLQIFKYTPIFVKQWVEIPQTGGVVKIRQSDEIKIDADIKAKITIDLDDDDEN
ncbi:MAG: hypothetical protein JXR46_02625 [Calditrichaceae bacterium]|nr:hypothetical protein [Calditrichaceae bacterium]MBN2707917.1 hypothetical protein [Calditrichaceae bacterium]RQV92319.1 MAG: hypothetical protein EH224_15885 [Calditrichota bacterium]